MQVCIIMIMRARKGLWRKERERERAELIMPNLELFVPLHTLSFLMHGLVITRMKHHHHPSLFCAQGHEIRPPL